MSDEISLLPEGMRKKEEALKKTELVTEAPTPSDFRFSMPAEEGEDVEVIEIDEGEIEQVLASEPPLTRLIYKVTGFFDELRHKIFQPQEPEPPPKLPPQFFAPSKPKPAAAPTPMPTAGAPATGALVKPLTPIVAPATAAAPAKPKARIIPSEKTPRRVRVIKRVRKPMRVSFVSEEDLRLLHIDVPKRKFTLALLVILFGVVIAGGAYALSLQQAGANQEFADAKKQAQDLGQAITQKQKEWSAFQDLEPRLKALIGLLDQHASPTVLLKLIEENTLRTVSYDAFSLTPDRKVTLGVVTDSYESAARQIVAFEKSGFVKKVEASGYTAKYAASNSLVPEDVRFQLTLTLSDVALKPQTVAAAP